MCVREAGGGAGGGADASAQPKTVTPHTKMWGKIAFRSVRALRTLRIRQPRDRQPLWWHQGGFLWNKLASLTNPKSNLSHVRDLVI